ncbi:class II aldolase [Methylobacterium radiotolerans]|jgi:L-fuculose-phosphate aldolase|uniref:L-fuculose-phosphate aldolase n=1 Tax=Methylobacterium radiotolerans (strain ATCC 27329 / DSM 1819 / JCM 2831 / NBRC 15690 / NCIMB 10815 / 0-1) TaxID=426355 RepID=B1M359_METRJ|nr:MULTISPECIES: class II aldolase/adducin family protein [Methylobacterium]GAN48392.1 L-fuculose phosphate aldolase [Methylobacterium sp. ME121]ACB24775.1 L-fuculose-phosphate aldolase [Methylobacterium radiotolerans JCM 2831]KTS10923.1 fuculose phosphate aldolase [Methylobacterium radiotolerans]KTS48947.1 fuculose phosphate aldolase [Methylobacterium radiotolerans]KZC00553.1 L-fuculose phosphate aldolase [Methylobacterium radiotolerans]
MDRDERIARESVVAAARALDAQGLNRGTSGNVSVRFRDGLLITPSGMPTDRTGPDDVVRLDLDGAHPPDQKPSSEWRFHRDILASRPEFHAVVHAHPVYCTAFAMCGEAIPAVHYMIAAFGGPTVRCAPYAPYGTAELSDLALAALVDRNVCLLANHGMIAAGASLEKALWLAVELETLCQQYAVARQIGTPIILSDDEIGATVERFRGYGLNAARPTAPETT